MPTKISLVEWRPLAFVTTSKRQIVHTLVARYFRCKSAVDINISSIITSHDPCNVSVFYLMHIIT